MPLPFETDTVSASELDQVTCVDRSTTCPSDSVPDADRRTVVPSAKLGEGGVTVSEFSTAGVTVTARPPETVPRVALTVVGPGLNAVNTPRLPFEFETLATSGAEDAHVTWLVRSWVVLSVNRPRAVKGWVSPLAMLVEAVVTVRSTSVAGVTVTATVPVTEPSRALTTEEPADNALTTPSAPGAFDTDAMPASLEAHVTWPLTSCVVSSVKMPVAVRRWLVPAARVSGRGVNARVRNTAAVTVTSADTDTGPQLAVTVAVPRWLTDTNPRFGATFDTAATATSLLDQVTCWVTSAEVPSLNTPVAMSACHVPTARLRREGSSCSDTNTAADTVTGRVAVWPNPAAVMVALPGLEACTCPWRPAAFDTVATAESLVLKTTWSVRSCAVPSE